MGNPREDFDEAVAFFVKVVAEVQPGQWSIAARGAQSVLEIAAQGSRPLTTTRDFLAVGASKEEINDTIRYFVRSRPIDAETAAGIQRRGREAIERLQGGDPSTIIADLAEQAIASVSTAPDDAIVGTQFGGMRLLAYLPTRTLELVTCGIEIADAIGSPTVPPEGVVEAVALLLYQVAIAGGKGPRLVKTIWTQVQLG